MRYRESKEGSNPFCLPCTEALASILARRYNMKLLPGHLHGTRGPGACENHGWFRCCGCSNVQGRRGLRILQKRGRKIRRRERKEVERDEEQLVEETECKENFL